MIAVAQPAARPGDGRRLLRFLTSLALLALAVTLRLPGPAPAVEAAPAEAPVVATAAAAPVDAPVVSPDDATAIESPAAVPPVAIPRRVTFATRVRAGVLPGPHGSRAPPAL